MKCLTMFFIILMVKSIKTEDVDTPGAISRCPEIKPANDTNLTIICKGRWFVMKMYSITSKESLHTCIVVDLLPFTENPSKISYNNTSELKGNVNIITTNVSAEIPGVFDFNDDLSLSTSSGDVTTFRSYAKVSVHLSIL